MLGVRRLLCTSVHARRLNKAREIVFNPRQDQTGRCNVQFYSQSKVSARWRCAFLRQMYGASARLNAMFNVPIPSCYHEDVAVNGQHLSLNLGLPRELFRSHLEVNQIAKNPLLQDVDLNHVLDFSLLLLDHAAMALVQEACTKLDEDTTIWWYVGGLTHAFGVKVWHPGPMDPNAPKGIEETATATPQQALDGLAHDCSLLGASLGARAATFTTKTAPTFWGEELKAALEA
eukprot:TRINITY_DN67197_c3_g5_i1.p1 TRINITY_DN67197_c3_g5~~TRINITY_DN67197_c3_g5_i1.p1  ORF type:complete len:232 (-),score=14.85 TRINITY_DN67197_c3_g5_i1:125-820(-)